MTNWHLRRTFVGNCLTIALTVLVCTSMSAMAELWTPSNIVTEAWYDAADTNTITLNGSNVSNWQDQSGNLNDATQGTGANQPASGGDINGLNAIAFDPGVGVQYLTNGLEQLTTVSMYLLINPTDRSTGYGCPIGASASGWGADSGLWWVIEQYSQSNDERNEVFYTDSLLDKIYCNGVEDSGNHNFQPAILSHQGTGLPTAGLDYLIGQRSWDLNTTRAYKGLIGEIIICPEEHDPTTRQKVEGYLAWKWGLQGDLPSGHSYKSAPPELDTTPPTAGPLSPANGAVDVAVDSDFTISFSESVKAGSGSILIKESGGTTHETVAVSDTGKVTFNTTNVTINIDTDLSLSTGYYILITNGVIEDLAGNPFAGITNASQWAFTAAATLPPAGIYEPFDYAAGDIDGSSQNGGVGMVGAWVTTGDQNLYDVKSTGLTFGSLAVAGKMVQRPSYQGDSELHREISDANKTALLANGSTLWFSILMRDAHYYDEHAADAFLLATGPITGSGAKPVTMVGGEGIGVSFKNQGGDNPVGMDVHGIIIDGGSTSLSTGFIDDTNGNENVTYLIAGKITWAADGSDDTLELFNITDPSIDEPESAAAFATMTADLDQSAFDTLAMATAQMGKFDEIRFALNFYEALGRELPPPSGTVITIR